MRFKNQPAFGTRVDTVSGARDLSVFQNGFRVGTVGHLRLVLTADRLLIVD